MQNAMATMFSWRQNWKEKDTCTAVRKLHYECNYGDIQIHTSRLFFFFFFYFVGLLASGLILILPRIIIAQEYGFYAVVYPHIAIYLYNIFLKIKIDRLDKSSHFISLPFLWCMTQFSTAVIPVIFYSVIIAEVGRQFPELARQGKQRNIG